MFDFNSIPEVVLPSKEELKAKDEAQLKEYESHLQANPGLFIGVSLTDWLEEVKAAGIPFVPAREAMSVNRYKFLNFDELSPESQELWGQMCNLRSEVPLGHMIRWDPCASLGVKATMAEEDPEEDEAVSRSFDMHPEGDPRAFDILYTYPAAEVPILSRPWVKSKMVNGYPVEFRVFIEDSKVIGIANYYPQRALPNTAETQSYVEQCKAFTESLVASMTQRNARPWMPNYERAGFDMSNGLVHGTVDFLVRQDGEVMFLEAGPPFGAGAHPCAFEGKEIKGVELGAKQQ